MISKLLYICIYVTLLSINNIDGSYSVCGNWQTYRDEKCIKIFDTHKMVTFDEALKSCSQMDNSSQILTIHSKVEQDFLNEYLFETQKLVENIWIGLRNKSKIFEWTDSSTNPYTNWRIGNPTNKTDYNCVQLEPDSLQWANEPCIRSGLVVCEKFPDITDFLKQILQTNEDIKEKKERIIKTEENLKKLEEDLRVTKDSLKASEVQFNETSDKINKSVSHYHLFTDINGKNKAFIIPLDKKNGYNTFDEAVNLCKNLSSTLIEIESKEKQLILESFLSLLGNEFLSTNFKYFWINGLRDSSGIWKWLKSNKPFTFTNWQENNPQTFDGYNNVYVRTYSTDTIGKWYNQGGKTGTNYAMCEYSS